MAENSKSHAEFVEGFQKCMKDLFKLIGQDDNFSELTAEVHDCEKYKSTKMVMELSRMHGASADQHVHKSKTPIKTQHVDSSASTSAQLTQASKKPEVRKPVDLVINLNPNGGGFRISRSKGPESSISKSSDSKSESLTSINKNLNAPDKSDASKVKKTKVHDPEVLLKKISDLEKEQVSLKKKIQDLTDENALLEAEKANVAELKLKISESNRKIETMEKVIEASRKQVIAAEDEISKLKQELSRKDLDSPIISENVEVIELESTGMLEFQQSVKEIVNLIQLDEQNLSELNVEIYYWEKSKLTTLLAELKKTAADQNVNLVKEVSKNTQKFTAPIKTYQNSRVKSDASKVKQIKSQDSKGLHKKISTLEKEQVSLKKKIQNLKDENALLEAEKANAAELKHTISESNRKIETMEKLLEASRKQVLAADDEKRKMKKEMSNELFSKLFESMEKQSVIEKRDEEITGLNTQIDQLKISHAAQVDRLNTRVEKLKTDLKEKIEFMEDLKKTML